MSVIGRIFKRSSAPKTETRGFLTNILTSLGLTYGFGSTATSITADAAMKLSAVYRCVEVISDAIAMLPAEVQRFSDNEGWSLDKSHKANLMLNLEPNPTMSKYSYMKAMIARMLLDGNGYTEIIRDKHGNAKRLELITDIVTVYQKDNGLLYYKIQPKGGDVRFIEQSNIIHLLNFSYNGIVGVSTLSYATDSLGIATAAEKSAKGFFSGGANLSGVLSTESKLTAEKAATMKASWATAFDTTDGAPQGVAVIEGGTTFTPVQVNPKEAQMLESRQFNVIEICRFFGVSPTKVFDLTNSAYSNVESMQLAFMTDTIYPLIIKLENEFNRKLFRPSERTSLKVCYDLSVLLRADLDSQANYYRKMAEIGVYTPNEIRGKIGNPSIKLGDVAYISQNMKQLIKSEDDERDTKSKS